MRKLILLLGILISLLSCHGENNEDTYYSAIVLEKGLDCGETFLIKFMDNSSPIDNNHDNIFYAINLGEEYKIENLEIIVTVREPKPSELLICTTLGPDYPQIFIIETEN